MFDDENEGLPPDEYINRVCEQDNIGGFNHIKGILEQQKEGCFASCWHNFDTETARMWATYGRDGVAVISSVRRLSTVLSILSDRVMIGTINYSAQAFRFNTLRFVTTKRPDFAWEREIRALIWVPELSGDRRHVDQQNRSYPKPLTPPPSYVPKGLRRHVDLRQLIERIVIAPETQAATIERVSALVSTLGLNVPVTKSELSDYPSLVTNLDDILKHME